MKILLIIAHQDDEFFVASRIAYELRMGNNFKIVYMTDGSGHGSSAKVRNLESLAALKSLGISQDQIHFLGSEYGFRDGHLYLQMSEAFHSLNELLRGQTFDQLYLSAWEGGHPDHDACHLIGLQFARMNQISVVREFSLYNGFATRFLRVATLIPRADVVQIRRKLTFSEAWAAFSLMRFYRSQVRTWLGLGIPAAISILIKRQECLYEVRLDSTWARPHFGPLLYEKIFGVSYLDFESNASAFAPSVLRFGTSQNDSVPLSTEIV